jgi:WD40 repeat protein
LHTTIGHDDYISACAISPDGQRIVSASGDKTLKIWDATNGQELQTLIGHRKGVTACAFSPDGKRIVSASRDKTIKIWDADSGGVLHTGGHWASVTTCAISPDGHWILSFSYDDIIRVWDADNGRQIGTFTERTGRVRACDFSPDGHWIVSASSDSTQSVFIESAREDKTLNISDLTSGLQLRSLIGHTQGVVACAFSPDGKWIISASKDKTIKIWDAATGREQHTLAGHTGWVRACAFSPDGKWIVSAGDDALRVWDIRCRRERCCIPLLGGITAVDLHPWKAIAGCGDFRGTIYLLDLVGITFDSIFVTAHQVGQNFGIRCPACQKDHSIKEQQLGSEMTCPTPGCGLRLKFNPFVVQVQ